MNPLLQFSITNPDNVFSVSPSGAILLNNRLMTHDEAETLKEEAEMLINTKLWAILNETMLFKAQESIFHSELTSGKVENARAILGIRRDYNEFLTILKGLTYDVGKKKKKVVV